MFCSKLPNFINILGSVQSQSRMNTSQITWTQGTNGQIPNNSVFYNSLGKKVFFCLAEDTLTVSYCAYHYFTKMFKQYTIECRIKMEYNYEYSLHHSLPILTFITDAKKFILKGHISFWKGFTCYSITSYQNIWHDLKRNEKKSKRIVL